MLNRPFQGRYSLDGLMDLLFPQGISVFKFEELDATGLPDGLMAGLQSEDEKVVTPLQAVCAAAALTNGGNRVPLQLIDAFELPESGWVTVKPDAPARTIYQRDEIDALLRSMTEIKGSTWQKTERVALGTTPSLVWYVGGTTSEWTASPVAVVIVLEGSDLATASRLGELILNAAMLSVD